MRYHPQPQIFSYLFHGAEILFDFAYGISAMKSAFSRRRAKKSNP